MKLISNIYTNIKRKISEIAEVFSGVYLQASPYGEVAYLQMKDFSSKSVEESALKVSLSPKSKRSLLKKGDLLFAGKGTTYLCKVFDLDIHAIASTIFYVIRLSDSGILPDYLCWYLNHPNTEAFIKAQQVGSGTPLIRKQILENLEIAVPDLKTQQQIVELARLQQKEKALLKALAEKREQLTNQLIMNKLNKYGQ